MLGADSSQYEVREKAREFAYEQETPTYSTIVCCYFLMTVLGPGVEDMYEFGCDSRAEVDLKELKDSPPC